MTIYDSNYIQIKSCLNEVTVILISLLDNKFPRVVFNQLSFLTLAASPILFLAFNVLLDYSFVLLMGDMWLQIHF